ncbi:MAG: DUF421 domain-containing protein [Pseudomonadota bacterium]|nr:DUF421 domain-containing protein [Pseudomonadota bacterium]
MFSVDWSALFGIQVSIAELVLRGSAIYLFLFLVFRFVLRRDVGSLGVADILLLVLLADAAQNAMAGEYKSISEGLILVGTIIGWNLLLDWLTFRFPAFAKFAQPSSLQLVRHGRVLHPHLAQEMITMEDLMSKLREHGIEHLNQVKHVYMEGDGAISVIKKTTGQQ